MFRGFSVCSFSASSLAQTVDWLLWPVQLGVIAGVSLLLLARDGGIATTVQEKTKVQVGIQWTLFCPGRVDGFTESRSDRHEGLELGGEFVSFLHVLRSLSRMAGHTPPRPKLPALTIRMGNYRRGHRSCRCSLAINDYGFRSEVACILQAVPCFHHQRPWLVGLRLAGG